MSCRKITCISCPKGCCMEIEILSQEINIKGNKCKRGKEYAINEIKEPKRIVTSTMRVENGDKNVVSVKTDEEISKDIIFDIIKTINSEKINPPVKIGDILTKDILNSGANIIATANVNNKTV